MSHDTRIQARHVDGRRIPLAILALFIALATACVTQPALASSPHVGVSGTYSVDVAHLPTPDCKPVGTSRTQLRCVVKGVVSTYSGAMQGTTSSSFTQFVDCEAGRTVGQGLETFTGSVHGQQGVLRWRLQFTARFDCKTSIPSVFRGFGAITQGSGALAGARGALVFGDTTYAGWVH